VKLRMKIVAGAAATALWVAGAFAFNASGINASLDYGANYDCGTDRPCQQGYWADAHNEWYPYYQQYYAEYWQYYGPGLCNYPEYESLCNGLASDINELYQVVYYIWYYQNYWA